MDIGIIKEFITLTEKVNFRETAREHFITQPSLTKHIQQLEDELGVSLFFRDKQSVTLTQMGELFLPQAKAIAEAWDEAQNQIAKATQKYSSALRISFLDAAARGVMPQYLNAFRKKYPDVRFELIGTQDIPETERLLENRLCDIALTVQTPMGQSSTCDSFRLYRDPLCAIMPKEHPLARCASLSLADLREETFIAASPDLITNYQRYLENLLDEDNIKLAAKIEVSTVEQGFMLVEAGFGIGVAPRHQRHFASDNLQLVPLEDENCYVDIVLSWQKGNSNPNIRKFISMVDGMLNRNRSAK